MRKHAIIIAGSALVLAGCGSAHHDTAGKPAAATSSPSPTTTWATPSASVTSSRARPSSTPTTARTTKATPTAAPSTDVRDCFDGDCTLLLTGATTIPLNATRLHYRSMRVVAYSSRSLTYSVAYPTGGGAETTVGAGLDRSEFGFRGYPAIEVGLTVVGGRPALVLQHGATE